MGTLTMHADLIALALVLMCLALTYPLTTWLVAKW